MFKFKKYHNPLSMSNVIYLAFASLSDSEMQEWLQILLPNMGENRSAIRVFLPSRFNYQCLKAELVHLGGTAVNLVLFGLDLRNGDYSFQNFFRLGIYVGKLNDGDPFFLNLTQSKILNQAKYTLYSANPLISYSPCILNPYVPQ